MERYTVQFFLFTNYQLKCIYIVFIFHKYLPSSFIYEPFCNICVTIIYSNVHVSKIGLAKKTKVRYHCHSSALWNTFLDLYNTSRLILHAKRLHQICVSQTGSSVHELSTHSENCTYRSLLLCVYISDVCLML